MRTQAHRIVDTDPKRGNVVVRVTGTRHDEPTYQVRQSLPNTQEVPGHDHHTNRVRETGSGSHGPILRSVPTNRLSQHLDRSSGSRQWLRTLRQQIAGLQDEVTAYETIIARAEIRPCCRCWRTFTTSPRCSSGLPTSSEPSSTSGAYGSPTARP